MVSTSAFKHSGPEVQCKIRHCQKGGRGHRQKSHGQLWWKCISLVISVAFPTALFGPHQAVQSFCHYRFYYHYFYEWKGRMTGREDVNWVYAWISLCGLSIVYKCYYNFCIVLTYFVIKNIQHFIIRALSPIARSTFL